MFLVVISRLFNKEIETILSTGNILLTEIIPLTGTIQWTEITIKITQNTPQSIFVFKSPYQSRR